MRLNCMAIQVLHRRRTLIWIFFFSLIHTKFIPVLAAPPDLASGLTIFSLTTTGAKVKWTKTDGFPADFDSYAASINPSAGTNISPNPIGVLGAKPETQITGLKAGVEYTISVYTQKGSVKGNPKNVTFNAKPNPLTGSNAITFTILSTIAVVHWTTPPGTFDKYGISITPSTQGAQANPSVVNNETTSTRLERLTLGTRYTVQVKTISGKSEGDGVSNSFTTRPVNVSQDTLDVTALAANSATLTWDAVTTGTFDDYIISISPTTAGETVDPATVSKGAATTTSLTSLAGGTTYTITLKTRAGGMESNPATLTFTFRTVTKPDSVDSATVTVGNTTTTTTAILSWGAVTTAFETYEITIRPTAGGAKVNPASVPNERTTTSLESLTPGTEYTVFIKTRKGSLGSESATMTFRTKPEPVYFTTIDVFDTTNTTAKVAWGKVTIGVFDVYSISVAPFATISPTSVASNVQAPKVALSTLSPGTVYTITIKTVSGGRESVAVYKAFRTRPPYIGSLSLVSVEMTTAIVKWTKPPVGTFTNYTIAVMAEETGIATPTVTPSTDLSSDASPSVALSGLFAGLVYTVSVLTTWNGVQSTSANQSFITKPPKVSSIEITEQTTTTATLKWTPLNLDAKYTVNYKYQIDIVPPVPTVSPHNVQHPGASTSLTGMTPGTKYKVKVTTIVLIGTLLGMSDAAEIDFNAKPDTVPVIVGVAVTSIIVIVTGVVAIYVLHRRRHSCFANKAQTREDRRKALETSMKQFEPVTDKGNGISKSTARPPNASAGDTAPRVMIHEHNGNDAAADYEVPTAMSHEEDKTDYDVLRRHEGYKVPPLIAGPHGTNIPESPQQVKLRPKSLRQLDCVNDEEFKSWLLSKDLTEETYMTLVEHGFQKASIFAILDSETVLKLAVKPLAQEMLLQRIVRSFSAVSSKPALKREGSEHIYNEVMIDNPYLSLC